MASPDAKRQEERVKLFASALSNSGVAAIVASVIGPIAAGRFQPTAAVAGFVIGAALHLGAQALLHYVVADEPKVAEEPKP